MRLPFPGVVRYDLTMIRAFLFTFLFTSLAAVADEHGDLIFSDDFERNESQAPSR
jgi:hypothetical protein